MSLMSWVGRTIGLGPGSRKFWASFIGRENWAGIAVNAESVMGIAAAYRAVNLYAGTIASLPGNCYEDKPGQAVLARGNEYDLVLRVSPNQDQTPLEFWEAMIGARFLVGNSYAEKIYSGSRLVALQILPPLQTEPWRDQRGSRKLIYRTRGLDGHERELAPDRVFHLKGFSFGGDLGMSPVAYGANTFSSTLAADKVSGKMFRSGLSTSGFLETGTTLEDGDRERLEKIMAEYAGSDNAGKMMILEGGMTYKPVTMTAADAQLLLARGFNIEEVARWFGMPPILLGHSSPGNTNWGTGTESVIRAWYTLGLRQEIRRVEDAVRKRVFSDGDRARLYFKFNVDALLRGDSAAQAALFSAAVQNGWMTRAEVRTLLELPFIEGSDKLTAQVNLVPLDKLGQESPEQQANAAAKMFRQWLGLEGTLDVPQLPAPAPGLLPPQG